MNSMLKMSSFIFIVLLIISGCTSQNSQNYGQDFDQLKAAKTRVSLGLTYLKNGNFSQAKYNLDKALEFAPRSADANFAMAYYYQSVSELEQAENAYQFAMDLDPKNANIANSYGAFLCQNGDYEKAKTYFLKAVNTSSYVSSAETYENLALCSQNQGRPEDSIQYLRSAINHQPGRASSLYLLSQLLVETQQWQEARGILRRYEKVSQISPQSLLMAMKIEQGTSNDSAAKGYLDMMLRIFPNDPLTKSALNDQLSSSVLTHKEDKVSALIKTPNSPPELTKPQANEKPSTNTVMLAEKNNLLVVEKDTILDAKIIEEAASVVVVEKLPVQVTQATEKAIDKIVSLTETNDLLVIEKNAGSDTNGNEQNKVVVAEELPEQEIQGVEIEIDNSEAAKETSVSFDHAKDASPDTDDLAQKNSVDVLEALPEQVLQVESEVLKTPDFHIVSKGENLYRISLLYNIKMQRLIDWNGLADASAIYDGKKLFLVAPSVVE